MKNPSTSEATGATLHYEGEAFKNHTLDLEHMADALAGLRVALAKAAAVRNEPVPQARLRVRDGSVVLDLSYLTQAKDGLLAVGDPAALLDLVFKLDDLAGKVTQSPGLIVSLLGLAVWLQGRSIKSRKEQSGNRYVITASDNATVIVTGEVSKLAYDKQARQAVRGLTAPLAEKDADHLIIRRPGRPDYKITRADRAHLAIGDPEPETTLRTDRRILSILHAPLAVDEVKGKKKRKEAFHFEDRRLGEKYWAEVSVRGFMEDYRSGRELLPYGTELDCEVTETLENLHDGQPARVKTRTVTKLHIIRRPMQQPELPTAN